MSISNNQYYIGLTDVLNEYEITHYLERDMRFHINTNKPQYALTLKELEDKSQEKLARYVGWDDATEIGLVGNIVENYWINPLLRLIPTEVIE